MANASVLIIDDDRSIVRLCQRLLERATYEVFASTDPMEALKILEGRKVDLLLADIRMPVMDGFELIERARGIQPDLAVLVMTGFGTVDTAVQALYKGVDGLILKPFENTADLVQAVQRVLIDSRQKQDAARLQALRPLFDISETLVSETSLKALEKLILDNIGSIFNAQFMCVYVASAGKGEPKLQMARNIPDPVATHAWAQVLRYALKSQASEVVPAGEAADGPVRAGLRSLGWSSLMIGPIVRSGQVFTFLAGRDARQQGFSESDLELFAILSRQSVVAMENARLYTDLKDYVRRVEDSQRALIQAEKMAAVGRLMASLAHEINNPLQSVRNCVHLAMRGDIEESQRSKYLTMTESEVERLVDTVRQMLDFYRPGSIEKELVDLREVIDQVVLLLRPQMQGSQVEFIATIPAKLPRVYGVKNQLQQVIFNLILNGLDAVENQPVKKIWLDVTPTLQEIAVAIEDSGLGIAAEVRDRLFEPFFSTKKAGTGLGLSISYSIVEEHGGRLGVIQGKHGQGACFEVRLPLAKEG